MNRRTFLTRMASAVVGVGLLGSELLNRGPEIMSVEDGYRRVSFAVEPWGVPAPDKTWGEVEGWHLIDRSSGRVVASSKWEDSSMPLPPHQLEIRFEDWRIQSG